MLFSVASSLMAQQTFNELEYSPQQTTFTLNAPSSARPVVKLFNAAGDKKPAHTLEMKAVGKDRWQVTVRKDLKGRYYAFNIGGKRGDVRQDTPGVFAKAVGVNGQRGAIIELPPFVEEEARLPQLESPADLIIYELHHRDFSIDPSSALPERVRGKYLALAEPKSIAHLKALGVNAVHILPSFDYASVDETRLDEPQYNWGYDPVNYNVPEGSYSTDPYDPECRIQEFRQMVAALHKAGIRVILDVVYNHTFDIEGSNFHKTYPGYYYRYNADGSPSNGSGCGNETASEKDLMRQFMIESMRWWVDTYHIDGFRVDLMGIHDIETMNQIKAALPEDIFIYGEGWSAGACAYPQKQLAMKANTRQLNGIAAFSDEMRDALRGPFSDDTKGAFLAGLPGNEESIKFGIVGAVDHPQVDMSQVNYSKASWVNDPTQMISYVSCHDDMCLTDRLRASIQDIQEDELIRLDLLAQTAVLTSQGVPFLLSGEEMLRDKKGVHNSYNSPDSINRLDWDNLRRYPHVFGYYANLIALRKAHPAFRMATAERVKDNLRFLPVSQPCLIAWQLNGKAVGDSWDDIIVVLNGNREDACVDIPQGAWTIVLDNGVVRPEGLGSIQDGKAIVKAQSALILKK